MNKNNLFIVAMFAAILASANPCVAGVSGIVTDSTGKPVSGALVTFTDESNFSNYFFDYTDDSGKYELFPTPILVEQQTPLSFSLEQNYPNPFNPSTRIPFTIESSGHVNLSVYNIMGQHVTTLIDEKMNAGFHNVVWNGRSAGGLNAAAGIYLYRLTFDGRGETRKMLLLDGGMASIHTEKGSAASIAAKPAKKMSVTLFTVTAMKGGFNNFTKSNVDIQSVTTLNISLEAYKTTIETKVTDTGGQTQVTDYAGSPVTVTFKNTAQEPVTGIDVYTVSSPYGTTLFCTDPQDRYFDIVYHVSSTTAKNAKPAPQIMWDFWEHPKIENYMEGEKTQKFTDSDATGLWNDFQLLSQKDPVVWKSVKPGAWDTFSGWSSIRKVTTVVRIYNPLIKEDSFKTNTMLLISYTVGDKAKSALNSYHNKLNARINTQKNLVLLMNDCEIQNEGGIKGKVLNADKDWFNGLRQVTVSITKGPTSDKKPVTSSYWGDYSFDGLAPGFYYLLAHETLPMTINFGGKGVDTFTGKAGQPLTIGPVYFRDYEDYQCGIPVKSGEYTYSDMLMWYKTLTNVSPLLYYRKKGQTSFLSTAMTATGNSDGGFQAAIPGDVVTTAGVEFKIEGTYSGETVTTPVYSIPVAGSTPTTISGITFVSIPGGTFQMGQTGVAEPVHSVTVSDFEMSVYEITNAQYAKYLNAALASGDITATSTSVKGAKGTYSGQEYIYLAGTWSEYPDARCWITYSNNTFSVVTGYENWPVVWVTWYGSKAFALYYGLDLSTEAEWEYACRGGRQYEYGTDDGTLSSAKANYWDNGPRKPVAVGSYPANPFGLYDMSGNVWEWCHDWYGSYSSSSQTNPSGAQSGSTRVVRGGSWGNYGDYVCRSANRGYGGPDVRSRSVGFRVVRRVSPQNY